VAVGSVLIGTGSIHSDLELGISKESSPQDESVRLVDREAGR
jgi:hypothetical protein